MVQVHPDAVQKKSIWKDDDEDDIWVIPKEPIGRTIIPPLFSTEVGKGENDPKFSVTATGTASLKNDWYLPFNGGLNGALVFDASDDTDGSSSTGGNGPSIEINCSDPSGMVFPSRLKIWSTKRHAPASANIYCKFKDGGEWMKMSEHKTETPFLDAMGDDPSEDAVQVLNMTVNCLQYYSGGIDMLADNATKKVTDFKIEFSEYDSSFYSGADGRPATMNIHKITFFRDIEVYAEKPGDGNQYSVEEAKYGYPPDRDSSADTRDDLNTCVCPTMEFTSSNEEDETMSKMTETLGRLLENTSCDDVLRNTFGSDLWGKMDTSAGGSTEAMAEAHINNKTEIGWKESTNDLSTGGKTRFAADVYAEMKGEAQALMNNDTLKQSRGCDAMTAMAALMTNAQKEASCLINKIQSATNTQGENTVKIVLNAGNITGSTITQSASIHAKMAVNFASDTDIGSTLNTIMSSMLSSMTEIENGLSAEGLFAPAVSATASGTISQRNMNEAARAVSNNVITQQLASLKNNVDLVINAKDITDSTVTQDIVVDSELLAGMMVRTVVENQLESKFFAETLADWKSENTADSEGVSFDWMGLLLAPVLAVVAGGLFLFLGGPAFLMRTLTTTRSRVAVIGTVIAAALIGHILCLIYGSVGGAIACGIVLVLGLFMAYKYWKASRSGEPQQ